MFGRIPREINDREIKFDPRPPEARVAVEDIIKNMKEMPEPLEIGADPFEYATPSLKDFRKIARLNRLDDIAARLRALTYGEMIELADELWNCRGDGIEQQGLPETLHRWAKMHTKEPGQ